MTHQEEKYKEVVEKVALDLGLPVDVVDKTYKSFWLFVRTTIEELPLKDDLSQEDFNKLKTNINIPSIGKFSCTYDRYVRVKKRFMYIKHLKDNDNSKEN